MKNKFKYFVLFPLMILIVILTLTYDVKDLISLGVRIPFGASYWKDSLSDGISTNKSIYLGLGDSLKYNGVTVTSGTGGGGIAASDNISFSGRVTTSDLWTFNDSAKFTRIVNMDSLRVGTTYHGTTKTLTAADVNYNLENGFEWQNRNTYQVMTLDSANGLIIRKKFNSVNDSLTTDSKFYFNDTAKFNSRIIATDRAVFNDSLIMSSYDIFLPNGKGLNWGASVGQIYSNSGEMVGRSALFTDYTLSGNFLNSSDSASGFLVRKKLEGYADTVTSESKWFFTDLINFATTVTFTVSPVFSALVNFANGINVTGTATFNGDMINTGWKKIGSSKSIYQYTRDTLIWGTMGSGTGTTVSVAHGITNARSILNVTCQVRDDSSKIIMVPNNTFQGTGLAFSSWWIDSLNCNIRITAGMINLDDAADTVKWFIKYSDYNR
jgi:hypothetical protein